MSALPPPAPLPPPVPPAGASERRLGSFAVLLLAAFLGALAAVVIGVIAAIVTWISGSDNCSNGDGWCELGSFVIGVLIGLAIAVVAYFVTGIIVVFRSRDRGERWRLVAIHIGIPIVLIVVVGLL